MIEFCDVSFSYPNSRLVLDRVSFSIAKHENVSFMGLSGCGKSTILYLICGLLYPDQGKIMVMGEDIARISFQKKLALCQKMGIAFQQGGLFNSLNVEENLHFAMIHMRHWPFPRRDQKVVKALEDIQLSHARKMFPHELSGGMKKRVSIARALCTEPKLALLDNPTAGLDPISSHRILMMIRHAVTQTTQQHHTSVLCFTSHIEIGLKFSERVIILHKTKIIADGSWKHLVMEKNSWTSQFLTARFQNYSRHHLISLGFPKTYFTST